VCVFVCLFVRLYLRNGCDYRLQIFRVTPGALRIVISANKFRRRRRKIVVFAFYGLYTLSARSLAALGEVVIGA